MQMEGSILLMFQTLMKTTILDSYKPLLTILVEARRIIEMLPYRILLEVKGRRWMPRGERKMSV